MGILSYKNHHSNEILQTQSFTTESIDMKFQLYIDLLKSQCRYLLPQNESPLSFLPV